MQPQDKRPRKKRQADITTRAQIQIRIPADGTHLAPFNILPGDQLTLELTYMNELRDTELLAVYDKDKNLTIGRCICDFGDERDEKGFGIEHATGGAMWCYKDEYIPFHILSITRTFKPDEPKPNECPSEEDKQRRLSELRARLEQLDSRDEITDCSIHFQLERQIYDLERELDGDFWPEVIGDE